MNDNDALKQAVIEHFRQAALALEKNGISADEHDYTVEVRNVATHSFLLPIKDKSGHYRFFELRIREHWG